jgi:ribA/ribD-fused uncharacterized protein
MEKFNFFWGGPFSQWYMGSPFVVNNITYPTAEHYMMWYKDQVFSGGELAEEILACDHPREAKMLGRMVKNFNLKIWEGVAKPGVFVGNMAKFTQDPELLKYLLDTKGTTIVEASPEDVVWGIGLAASDPRAAQRETWRGNNWLGEVIQDVRDTIILGRC